MGNYLVLPEPADIRAARAYKAWKQMDLAYKCKVNISTINAIETEKSKPSKELLDTIATVFAEEGVYFLPGGGHKINKNILTVYEGSDCLLRLQDNIIQTLQNKKDKVVLVLGDDDEKLSPEEIEKDKEIYNAGIHFKSLISKDNDYIMGPLEDYRRIGKEHFISKDDIIIYDTKIVLPVNVKNGIAEKLIALDDKDMSDWFKRYFNHLWEKGGRVTKSSVKQVFFKRKQV